jgi:hypothetical protein
MTYINKFMHSEFEKIFDVLKNRYTILFSAKIMKREAP